jgi:2-dehydro-3-deoxyphosphooctonate aldolase (KDO 8-P synthase)
MNSRREFEAGGVRIGGQSPLMMIAGPCVIESAEHAEFVAKRLKDLSCQLTLPIVFKASYDKANRSSLTSYRGPGLREGMKILSAIKQQTGLPVLTDVHEVSQVEEAAAVCDILQVPAFLCRQTDLLLAVGRSGRAVNIKKGQFLSPWEMASVVEKVASTGNERILVTERGTTFGYRNLVVDMRSLAILNQMGFPVIFDATHSVQLPGGEGKRSGGQPEFIEPLARAAAAVGVDGIFVEVHENPSAALSDGSNALPLDQFQPLAEKLIRISALVRTWSVT